MLTSPTMATEHIIELLLQERDRLDRAIEALRGPAKPKPSRAAKIGGLEAGGDKPKRTVSAAGRKRIAAAQKKRWAAIKKAKG